MSIIFNGTIFSNGGTSEFNGTSLSLIKVSINGGTATEVWKRSVICTDLVRWYDWTISGNVNGGNSKGEGSVSASNGIQLLSGAPNAGVTAGQVSQAISMVNGHKYWLYFGAWVIGGLAVNTPLGDYTYQNQQPTVSAVISYTGSSGSKGVTAKNTSSDQTASDYSRLCFMNIVDLTAAFGSGNEPTASWCVSNLGIFNGNKSVVPA